MELLGTYLTIFDNQLRAFTGPAFLVQIADVIVLNHQVIFINYEGS